MDSKHRDELIHYGVPGMKWGVRRNARVLANRRRNVAVTKAKKDYKTGKITKDQKKTSIQNANVKKKSDLTKMKTDIKNVKNREELQKVKQDISIKTIKEVPHSTIKKGATTVNKFLGTYHATTTVATAGIAAAVNPAFAGAMITAGAIGAAAEVGTHYLLQIGIDRVT